MLKDWTVNIECSMTKRSLLFFFLTFILAVRAWGGTIPPHVEEMRGDGGAVLPPWGGLEGDFLWGDERGGCKMVCIVPERLPDLNMPRSGHAFFYANGELTLTGGHTTNFVPTPTAEYYADGQWHLLTMAYAHDNGFAVTLPSGEVIIGGGHTEPLGVGQSFLIERYMPANHTFEGFGCLDHRRVLANATLLTDGRVIIAGNHYADDAIGCYDGQGQVLHVKAVRQGRSNPYILPIADDNAIIVGSHDVHDSQPDTVWVDQVKGDAFRVPLLETWRPVYTDQPFSSLACSIGNHSYLLTAFDKEGQLGIIVVNGGNGKSDLAGESIFSLLPTSCPIPMQSPFGPILYKGPIVVDQQRRRGYVVGVDSLYRRQYVLAIDYARRPAALTLYYTDTLEHSSTTIPIVTPDGDLILAGGITDNNYKPVASVWLYRFGTPSSTAFSLASLKSIWLWVGVALLLLFVFLYIIIYRSRSTCRHESQDETSVNNAEENIESGEELMSRICQWIESDQRYLTQRLKPTDMAIDLGVSVAELNDCISRQRHCTFAQLIAEYRVGHAQRLLTDDPEMKLVAVIEQSGFSSESTFFRSFKAVTGLSPKEWLAQNGIPTATDNGA